MSHEDLVDRIANGKANLLGIDDICKRLGISRTTFDRWVKNGGGKSVGSNFANLTTISSLMENALEGNISFPPPDIRIGNSPKWEMETFKSWLRANVTKEAD